MTLFGSIEKKVVFGFGLSIFGIIILAAIAFHVTNEEIKSSDWVAHTEKSVATLAGIHILSLDAESTGRAYLISGNAKLTEKYARLLPLMDGKVQAFRELTTDNASQQRRVEVLGQQVHRRFAYLSEQMNRRRDDGVAAMQQNSKLAEGRLSMDALMATLTQMTDEENRLLALRKADREASIYQVWATIVATVLAGCALLAWALRQTLVALRVRREAEEQASYLAHHDGLTDLPNRRMLQDQLLRALSSATRHGHKVAVLCLDLDGFKKVNDTLGHDTGDALLKEVAVRLVSVIRKEDTGARIGGDEFIIGLMHVQQPDEAVIVAQKVINEFSQPFICLSQGVSVTASVGIAIYPEHGATMEEISKRADVALYEAKSAGKNRFRVAGPAPAGS